MSKQIIYYTGIGAKKSGKHTPEEFIKIMNKDKNINLNCSTTLATNKIANCKKYYKKVDQEYKKHLSKKTKVFKISKKTIKLKNNCDRQLKKSLKNPKPCTLEEFIEYSGAEKRNA